MKRRPASRSPLRICSRSRVSADGTVSSTGKLCRERSFGSTCVLFSPAEVSWGTPHLRSSMSTDAAEGQVVPAFQRGPRETIGGWIERFPPELQIGKARQRPERTRKRERPKARNQIG